MYSFDDYGWYSVTEIADRQTDIAPPEPSAIPDGYAANFTGYGWAVVPYIPPPPPDPRFIKKVFAQAVKDHLNAVVDSREYFDIDSACSYALSYNPTWKAEGEACVQWRDACWAKCYQILDQVSQGIIPQPTPEGLVAMLPVMVWPD